MSRPRLRRRDAAASPSRLPPPSAAPPASPPATQVRLPDALVVINALGRKCPIPILMLAEQIRDVPVGAVIAVLADDPAAYTDVPAWAAMKSHDLAFREDYQTGWAFGIRRNY
jgi:tRNA 2-thiouridine synthesizing protein A